MNLRGKEAKSKNKQKFYRAVAVARVKTVQWRILRNRER
ncbi:hypothetical protein EV688_10279 [Chromatocurvus halotolerans]|uniref:Uncharacterized protein n=1 Tax=Chromatocurvus halotolerans TaxID=1132028 RepID=A0A4R2KX48_9GAMM|nr:hypothetical protein EV688_10279 [Chromatocurvus halotolerans]